MRIVFPAVAAAALAGCLPPHPPPAPAPTEVAYVPGCGDAAASAYGTPETLDRFAGRYRLDDTVIAVRHDGQRLVLDRPGFTPRQLQASNLEAGAFEDGCGIGYRFAPSAGPVATLVITLADGSATLWQRQG